jgi:hypothetical protein
VIVTIDTNVLVSGTVFRGIPGKIIDAAIDRTFTLALSPAILREYEDVLLRSKFGLHAEAVQLVVRDIEAHAVIVHPTKRHSIIANDPDDNAVIDCAVEATADYIVSGDAHLTELAQVKGIPVVTPAQFVEQFKQL